MEILGFRVQGFNGLRVLGLKGLGFGFRVDSLGVIRIWILWGYGDIGPI